MNAHEYFSRKIIKTVKVLTASKQKLFNVFPDYNLFSTNSTLNWLMIPKNTTVITDRKSRQTKNNSKVNFSYFDKKKSYSKGKF